VGPYLYWRIRIIIEEVAYEWHLGYLGAIGLLKPTSGHLTPRLGTSGLLSLHVDVWRLIFLKLSLPRDGVRRCSTPCNSILYVRSFFKNGTDLTVFMILQVIYACLLLNGVFINLLLNHGVRGLQGIYFFVSAQVANAGCMCSVIVYFLHCICVCDYDGRHESLIMLSHSVMIRRSHLLARCYLGTMCMCTTYSSEILSLFSRKLQSRCEFLCPSNSLMEHLHNFIFSPPLQHFFLGVQFFA
jgi:hypothetical protein